MARLGRPVIMAAATAKAAQRNVDLYRTTAKEAGLSTDAIDRALSQCWVARSVILAPTDKEATEVGLPYFKAMQTYRAAQSEKYDAKRGEGKRQHGAADPVRRAGQHDGRVHRSWTKPASAA